MNDVVLIGNSFPLSLIRRPVKMEPCSIIELQKILQDSTVVSFWGHGNTLATVNSVLGYDLTPSENRPVLTLSPSRKVQYKGMEFSECWILSPDYCEDFRPAVGEEVPPEKIKSWQCLKITFD